MKGNGITGCIMNLLGLEYWNNNLLPLYGWLNIQSEPLIFQLEANQYTVHLGYEKENSMLQKKNVTFAFQFSQNDSSNINKDYTSIVLMF